MTAKQVLLTLLLLASFMLSWTLVDALVPPVSRLRDRRARRGRRTERAPQDGE